MATCLGVSRTISQFLLILVNILVALLGLAVMIIGIWSHVSNNEYIAIAGTDEFTQVSVLLIIIGIFILIVGAIGSVGGLFASKLFGRIVLGLYAVVLGLLVICEISGGIAAAVLKDKVETEIRKSANETFSQIPTSDNYNNTWNSFQRTFKCCGVFNYTDYIRIYNNNHTVPTSCCNTAFTTAETCPKISSELTVDDVMNNSIYTAPCAEAVIDALRKNLGAIAGGAIVIGLIQIVGIVLSCFVALFKPSETSYEVV